MSSLLAVVAAWLNASQRSRNGLGMNRSARGEVYSTLSSPKDWIPCYIRTYFLITYNLYLQCLVYDMLSIKRPLANLVKCYK